MPAGGDLLEIGCGNGFTASLLSGRARRVMALDLPLKDPASHSVGIKAAGELTKRLGVKNMGIIGASAEALPFPNGSFDIVLSEYALHYVKRPDMALKEIHRVLNDKGTFIAVVPNFTERVFAPLIKYEYLAKRALLFGFRPKKRRMAECRPDSALLPGLKEKMGGLADWLGLKPDGAYKSFTEELLRHRPSSWKQLFSANGFKVVNMFSVQLLPAGLFDILGSAAGRLMARAMNGLNYFVGNSPIAKRAAYSLGIAAVKDI